MVCQLKLDTADKTVPGKTLYSKSGIPCLKDTAVYVPQIHNDSDKALNVVLWLHGYYVHSAEYLFQSDPTRLREKILRAGRDVVLIAPHLGWWKSKGNKDNHFDLGTLAEGNGGQQYLNGVLDALTPHLGLKTRPMVSNLVIACHSGGGRLMRVLVKTMGSYDSMLRECWGFDCLYNSGDASFWFDRVNETGHGLFIVYGRDTIEESVKLYLMAQGKADSTGAKLATPRGKDDRIVVTPPFYQAFPMYGQMVDVKFDLASVDDDMRLSTAGDDKNFVSNAINNLNKNYAWPTLVDPDTKKEIGSLHYFTTEFLTSRLKGSKFF